MLFVIQHLLIFLTAYFWVLDLISNAHPSNKLALRGLALSLAIPIGFSISSVFLFLWLLTFDSASIWFVLCENIICLSVLRILLLRKKKADITYDPILSKSPLHHLATAALSGAALYLIYIEFVRFTGAVAISPHGAWDAWSIWNMRARFLFHGGSEWETAFDPFFELLHPDYPLFVPLSVVRGWLALGTHATWIPAVIPLMIMNAAMGAIIFGCMFAQSEQQGLLCIILLAISGKFSTFSATLYADLPLASFFVFTAIAILVASKNSNNVRAWILPGIFGGAAAWTKNEGFPFLVALFGLICIFGLIQHGRIETRRKLAWMGVGAAPFLFVLLLFKLGLAPANDLLAHAPLSKGAALLDPMRRAAIVSSATNHYALYYKGISIWIYVGVLGGLLRIRKAHFLWSAFGVWIGLLCAMHIAYFLAFIWSPYDLAWHISTSIERLFFHLFPLTLLTISYAVPSVQELLSYVFGVLSIGGREPAKAL